MRNSRLDNSLSQLVTSITRSVSNSILNLLITSNPNLIEYVQMLPGISDHCLDINMFDINMFDINMFDINMFDINIKPKLHNKPQRKIELYDRVDLQIRQTKVQEFVRNFLASNPEDQSVATNWDEIRNGLDKIVDDNVPSKLTKGKRDLPWITSEIKHKKTWQTVLTSP